MAEAAQSVSVYWSQKNRQSKRKGKRQKKKPVDDDTGDYKGDVGERGAELMSYLSG